MNHQYAYIIHILSASLFYPTSFLRIHTVASGFLWRKLKSLQNQSKVDMEVVLSELDCPVCLEKFNPPIYICSAGHSICSGCRFKVLKCPTCRAAFSNGRNYSLEKILSAVYQPCKYYEQGCKEVICIQSDSYNSHIMSCHYRELKCMCCDRDDIQYTKFPQHLDDKHEDMMYPFGPDISSTFSINLIVAKAKTMWKPRYFQFNNNVIFIQCETRGKFLVFSLWKYPHNTVALICDMKINLSENFIFSCRMKVNSYRNTFEANIKNGTVASIPRGAVFSNTKEDPVEKGHLVCVTFEIIKE